MTSDIQQGLPCPKLYLLENFNEDLIALSRDLNQIVEERPISQR